MISEVLIGMAESSALNWFIAPESDCNRKLSPWAIRSAVASGTTLLFPQSSQAIDSPTQSTELHLV
jgi:hypothetical protein